MAFLTGFLGTYYEVGVVAPSGLWEWLILNVFNWGFLFNYGWRVLVFTLILKLLLSPIDVFQRLNTRKNQKVSEKIAPALERLERQYGDDQKALMQRKAELMKQMGGGTNMLMSCLPLILTLVIFITLFTGLRTIGSYKNLQQYTALYNEYLNVSQVVTTTDDTSTPENEAYATLAKDGNPSQERIDKYQKFYVDGLTDYIASVKSAVDAVTDESYANMDQSAKDNHDKNKALLAKYDTATEYSYSEAVQFVSDNAISLETFKSFVGACAVFDMYDATLDSFLWIKNIWAVDAPWVGTVNDYNAFKTNTTEGEYRDHANGCGCSCSCNCSGEIPKLKVSAFIFDDSFDDVEKAKYRDAVEDQALYNKVMSKLMRDISHNKNNGYLVLPILSIVLSFLTTWLSMRQQKQSGQDIQGSAGSGMKFTMWMMPVLIGFFSFSYTASFALYLVVSYFMSLITNVSMMVIFKLLDRKDAKEDRVIKHGRPNFNE